MSQSVKLNAKALGGAIQTQYSGYVTVGADGTVTVDSRDAASLLAAGASYINTRTGYVNYPVAPVIGTVGKFVASTSLANGTLSIANQPDVPRMGLLRVDPGASAVTAGNAAITYVANDGTTQVDNLSVITGASTLATLSTSKGMMLINSVILTGVVGGTTPHVQLSSDGRLACPVDAGFQDFAVVAEWDTNASATPGAVTASAAAIAPTAAVNGTATYSFGYTYIMPNT